MLELEVPEDVDFLNLEDSVFTGDMYISNEELNHSINSFIDGLVGKHRSVDRTNVITDGSDLPQHDGEKIRSDLIFDKIELQYIKRKLL